MDHLGRSRRLDSGFHTVPGLSEERVCVPLVRQSVCCVCVHLVRQSVLCMSVCFVCVCQYAPRYISIPSVNVKVPPIPPYLLRGYVYVPLCI